MTVNRYTRRIVSNACTDTTPPYRANRRITGLVGKDVGAVPNNADIMVQPVAQLCRAPIAASEGSDSVIGVLYGPSKCYDLYVAGAMRQYGQCQSHHSLDKHEHLRHNYTAGIRSVVRRALQRMGRDASVLDSPSLQTMIRALAEITFVYERCYLSSILRTGQ